MTSNALAAASRAAKKDQSNAKAKAAAAAKKSDPQPKPVPKVDIASLKQRLDIATVDFNAMRKKNDELRLKMDEDERQAELALKKTHKAYHGLG